jgi:hypothetical protein
VRKHRNLEMLPHQFVEHWHADERRRDEHDPDAFAAHDARLLRERPR